MKTIDEKKLHIITIILLLLAVGMLCIAVYTSPKVTAETEFNPDDIEIFGSTEYIIHLNKLDIPVLNKLLITKDEADTALYLSAEYLNLLSEIHNEYQEDDSIENEYDFLMGAIDRLAVNIFDKESLYNIPSIDIAHVLLDQAITNYDATLYDPSIARYPYNTDIVFVVFNDKIKVAVDVKKKVISAITFIPNEELTDVVHDRYIIVSNDARQFIINDIEVKDYIPRNNLEKKSDLGHSTDIVKITYDEIVERTNIDALRAYPPDQYCYYYIEKMPRKYMYNYLQDLSLTEEFKDTGTLKSYIGIAHDTDTKDFIVFTDADGNTYNNIDVYNYNTISNQENANE